MSVVIVTECCPAQRAATHQHSPERQGESDQEGNIERRSCGSMQSQGPALSDMRHKKTVAEEITTHRLCNVQAQISIVWIDRLRVTKRAILRGILGAQHSPKALPCLRCVTTTL